MTAIDKLKIGRALYDKAKELSEYEDETSQLIKMALSEPKGRGYRLEIQKRLSYSNKIYQQLHEEIHYLKRIASTDEEIERAQINVDYLKHLSKDVEDNNLKYKKIRSFKIVSVFNYKGGCSKTSTNFTIATMLSEYYNKKCLVMDLDSQGDLTSLFDPEYENLSRDGIKNLFINEMPLPKVIQGTVYPGVDIITNDINSDDAHSILEQKKGTFASMVLHNIIEKEIEYLNENYDYIILDFAPNIYSQINRNGFFVVDSYILITKPESLNVCFTLDAIINFEVFLSKPYMRDNFRKPYKTVILKNMIRYSEKTTVKLLTRLNDEFSRSYDILETEISKTENFAQKLGINRVLNEKDGRIYEEYIRLIDELIDKKYL